MILEVYAPIDLAFVEAQAARRGLSPEQVIADITTTIQDRIADDLRHLDGVVGLGIRVIVDEPLRVS